ncbi:MAG TPA: HNH endonuclease [Terriglobales bacterium]|nr:HNH endonuclease [Terriglobales bacterium]
MLVDRVRDAIYDCGWRMIFENDDHPVRIRAFRGSAIRRLLLYIWRLTPGGPRGVRPAGELRIQLTGVDPPLLLGQDFQTLLLGWHEPTRMFAGFDVQRRPRAWGHSPSVQIRQEAIRDAGRGGFGIYRRATGGRGEIAVAFSPEAFMDYVEQQATLHEFAGDVEESAVLTEAARGAQVDLDHVAGHGRREAVRRVVERVGQENFRTRILTVYDYACAVCEVQLELVEAAHIIPVPAGGTNRTANGVALCSIHHEAYDRALIGIRPDYSVDTNAAALRRLRRVDRHGGWDSFEENLREEIVLPDRAQDRPDPVALEEGLRLRGWQ